MERTLQEKRDAEHFLRVLAPKYKTVIVVDLQQDTVRPVIVPDYFQSVLDTCGGSFRAALTNYRDTLVAPEDRDALRICWTSALCAAPCSAATCWSIATARRMAAASASV